MVSNIFYFFSASWAIILLLRCLKGEKRKYHFNRYFPGGNVIERDDENNCALRKDKLRMVSREVYINIIAFCDLIIGKDCLFMLLKVKEN